MRFTFLNILTATQRFAKIIHYIVTGVRGQQGSYQVAAIKKSQSQSMDNTRSSEDAYRSGFQNNAYFKYTPGNVQCPT
jgi:hypothetical protein